MEYINTPISVHERLREFEDAKEELKLAEQDFNYAECDYIDAAIFKLNAAIEMVNNLRVCSENRIKRKVNFKWSNSI